MNDYAWLRMFCLFVGDFLRGRVGREGRKLASKVMIECLIRCSVMCDLLLLLCSTCCCFNM